MRSARSTCLLLAALAAAPALAAAGDAPAPRAPLSLAGRLVVDQAEDGALWALGGGRYKARFDASGASYRPYLGAGAPASGALAIALRSAERGGVPLELSPAEPRREGDFVVYERGALTELYELRADSIEQLFVLDELPGSGDLVLRVALGSEQDALESAAGWTFAGERGGASYSRAVAFDARGEAGAISTSYAAGEVEIRVAAGFLAHAVLPLTIDPVIETVGVTSDDDEVYVHSDVAYDAANDRFVVVYEHAFSADDHDVLSVLYSADGEELAGSLVGVDISSACWRDPRVASNSAAAQFLTVARTSADCSPFVTIQGRTRQAASTSQGPKFLISPATPDLLESPRVGGNSGSLVDTYYCVLWVDASKGTDDIHYQIVRTSSTLLFGAPQGLAVGGWEDNHPSISKSCGREPIGTQRWNVVWQRGNFSGVYNVYGAQIQWSGAITTPAFPIATSLASEEEPSVSSPLDGGGTAPRPYMVTFERDDLIVEDVWAVVLAEDEILVEAEDIAELEGGTFVDQDQTRPVVDSDGQGFTVAYREHFFSDPANRNVYVSSFRLAGGALVPLEVHEDVGISLQDQDLPAISAMHAPHGWQPDAAGRFFVSWQEERLFPDTWAIEAAVYQLEHESAGAPGVALCFGDGSGSACPCGNTSGEESGCVNTRGVGCRLRGVGSASVLAADLVLVAEQAVPGQPGLFFQGGGLVLGGSGIAFGDGLRCCGGSTVRLEIAQADASGLAHTSSPVAANGGVAPGDTRCYQFWYRDPAGGGVCGGGFNLSNAFEVRWIE